MHCAWALNLPHAYIVGVNVDLMTFSMEPKTTL